jgi:hypothetical protein
VLDIDHLFPWSAWACGDLWNLLPTHRITNQREKRDRLPSAPGLTSARGAILGWWDEAWRSAPALEARFGREASATLGVGGSHGGSVYDALEWRHLRLPHDQQMAEWSGA